ncbi:MAG: EAL domain-containing protein [Phycisphaerales bacterium]|nr:EAL domain-containing protein [Phycisphaerales bacterium]
MQASTTDRAGFLFREAEARVHRRTDVMFGVLFVLQFVGAVVAALTLTPRTWAGSESSVHVHVWAGLLLGALLCLMPLTLIVLRRGEAVTRYTIAVSQMLFSALLIHMTGGRIETHFHIFGSLAFLAFYRDWRVLVPATVVIAADHLLRGFFWPESVFGVLVASPWRAFEHAGWVVFEDIFLAVSCVVSRREMMAIAESRAEIENAYEETELKVQERTAELRAQSESLALSEERFRMAVQGSQHGIWDWNLETNEVYYAPQWKQLIGCGDDAIGTSPDEWFGRIVSGHLTKFHDAITELSEGETELLDIELEMTHADGLTRWMLCRATAHQDQHGKVTRLAGSLADISELKAAQERLRVLAHHDRLTGLPNRAVFTERVSYALACAKRDPKRSFAVLFGDFDGFKNVNDSLGHAIGDAMLIRAAECFRSMLREVDTVARMGGDEFALILEDVQKPEEALETAERLIDAFREPYNLKGHEVISTLSLGLVMSGSKYESAEAMLGDADAAMYQAKTTGKNCVQIFDEEMHEAAMRRLDTERELRAATRDYAAMDKEFRLQYQPIVELADGRIAGFEALVRWDHPVSGLISPDQFIPIAEDAGMIIPLGEWTLMRACEQAVIWRRNLGPSRPFKVNVNLSRRQLMQPDLIPMLERVLEQTGVRPSDLVLELTETSMMDERIDAVEIMNRIKTLGIGMAMDDFGTGHSSLSCLRQFPIQTLKIDRAFLLTITEKREFSAVVQAIITLAYNLNLNVVAEGVENDAQLVQLQAMECGCAQGFYFSRAVDARDATRLLDGGLELPSLRAA